jgi:hypothetical protein
MSLWASLLFADRRAVVEIILRSLLNFGSLNGWRQGLAALRTRFPLANPAAARGDGGNSFHSFFSKTDWPPPPESNAFQRVETDVIPSMLRRNK